MTDAPPRPARRTMVGTVVSARMAKTIVVERVRLVRHPRYGKVLRRSTILKAHDGGGEAKVGDTVRVAQTRRISKTKAWRLVEVVRRAPAAPGGATA